MGIAKRHILKSALFQMIFILFIMNIIHSVFTVRTLFVLAIILLSGLLGPDSQVAAQERGSFTDPRDGKVYQTVKVGDQWIMAENFAYKPEDGKFWVYNNDQANLPKYGYLYDWETANKIAPAGWHLPSRKEWVEFRKALGGKRAVWKYSSMIFKPIMEGGSSGFDALLGGIMDCGGNFKLLGERTEFWSSTNSNFDGPWHFDVVRAISNMPFGDEVAKAGGFASLRSYECFESGKSVRLFKD